MISEFASHDCDELSESLAYTEQVFRQRESGPFFGKWRLLELPGVSIVEDEISHSIFNSAVVASGYLIVFIPIRQQGSLVVDGHAYDKPCLFLGQPNTRPILTIPSDFKSYTIEFELQTLHRYSESLGLPIFADWYRIPNVNLIRSANRLIERAFRVSVLSKTQSPQEVADAFITGWLKLMSETSDHAEVRDRSTLVQRRCAAIDAANYILDNLGNDLSLADLCEVAGVSERTLRNGFHEIFGMSPNRWLKCERLAAARKDLKAADPIVNHVCEIAIKYGFTQFAHFATDYRKQFGESPSKTLRR